MSNSFEALTGLRESLREEKRRQADIEEKQAKATRKAARETDVRLSLMSRHGQIEHSNFARDDSREAAIDFKSAMLGAGVKPLGSSGSSKARKTAIKPAPEPRQTMLDNQQVLRDSISDIADTMEFLESDDGLSFRRPEVGPDVPRDLRRGRWTVMGQLDLHGMFVDEARLALVDFLAHCQKNDRLCVRVIHGKGNGSPDRRSILKEMVRRWLKQRDEVLAFCEPRKYDGGSGATLIRLKARRR